VICLTNFPTHQSRPSLGRKKFPGLCLTVVGLQLMWLLSQTALAAVGFTVTPSAVSNTYSGFITLQVTNLSPGDTVVVQKFLDLNGNGVIDAGDWMVQQFQLTDGQAGMVIGGIVNSNVPGDTDGATNGQITAQLNFQNGDFIQNIVGQYLFKVSSPGNHFTPITNLFNVANAPYAQEFTGNVVSNAAGTGVPNAVVLLISTGGHGDPLAGTVANNSSGYTLPAPPGTYGIVALQSNYVCNFSSPPVLALGNGQTIPTNLTMLAATSFISGQLVDAINPGIGLPGIFFNAQATNGLMSAGFTDSNGYFSLGAQSGLGQWQVGLNEKSLIIHGYLELQNNKGTNVNPGQTDVTLAVPQATALFYGHVKDSLGNPMPGLEVYAYDSDNMYEGAGYTDANGHFNAGALGGLGNDTWQTSISSDTSPANYLFVSPVFDQNGGTNLGIGQAVQSHFTGLLVTNSISGYLRDDNGNPIAGVGVNAGATINNVNYQTQSVDTDTNGYYLLDVSSGYWSVNVNCACVNCDCTDCLSTNYQCPNSTNVTINSNNATSVNFTAFLAPYTISGYVLDNNGSPIAGVGVYAGTTNYQTQSDTGSNGYYSLNVGNGAWLVGVSTCGSCGDGLPGNYLAPASQMIVISNGNATANFIVESLQSRQPLQITTTTLPNGALGAYYDQSLAASGGQLPYVWGLAPGSAGLPAGLSLTTNGVISGIPGASGASEFIALVTDAMNGWNYQLLALTINISSNPPVVVLTAPERPGTNQFQFTFNSVSGVDYTIQYSTNLKKWTSLLEFSGSGGTETIIDPGAGGSERFYRVMVP
jgi:hypothetical protein